MPFTFEITGASRMKVNHQIHAVAAALAILAGSLAATPAVALEDAKGISPNICMPRGPGTTVNELTYGPYGVTNPGDTNETVLCAISGDSDDTWSATTGASAYVYVHYRTGAVSGSVSCSAFAGSAVTTSSPTFSSSATSGVSPANYRGSFYIGLADVSQSYGSAPPTVIICTLSPKAAIGWLYFKEYTVTNTP
jgi:hypothetical protein